MKHNLHKWVAMFIASVFAVSAWAQEDVTSKLVNADLSTADGWNTDGTKGISGGMVKVASESAFDFCQTITLPAGQYKVTARAAYRYGGTEQGEYDAIQAGTETHLVKLYAQTATYKYEGNVQNRWEGASDTDYAAGSGSVTVNGKYVPNSSDAVKIWFDNGQYVNELVFNVQAEGEVKIGITRVGGIGSDYTNIGAWTLTRLGDAEADPVTEEPTPEPEPDDDAEETIDVDLTHLVGTSKEAWNTTGGPVTIDGVSMPEVFEWNANPVGDVMWQEIAGLENGKYTVELWANARLAHITAVTDNGQENCTYLFANNVEITIPVYHDSGLANNKSWTLEGVEVTDGTLKMGMTKKAAGSNWHTIQIKSLIYHAPANAALDIAKAELKAALDAATAVSPASEALTAAIATAQAVYDNATTIEEVEAAVAPLQAATTLAVNTNAVAGASPASPALTNFVVNGTFDSNVDPWKNTTNAQNHKTANNQTGAFTGNFCENWNPSAVAGKIYQVIENVPNGIYDLSICAFVSVFDASVQFVYANGDKVALTAAAPTAYTVRTIVENNTIEIGFEQTTAVAEWMGIDNVSLTYLGENSSDATVNIAKAAFTAAYDEFNAALTACQAMMLKMSFYEVADAADQLNNQLETTTDVDALNAMVETLNEATASLNEINEVYAEYDVFVQKFKAASEISMPKTQDATDLLEFYMYGGAGMQASSVDALKQAIQTAKDDYLTYVANAELLDDNVFDLTFLIVNAEVTSKDGWETNAGVGAVVDYEGAPENQGFEFWNGGAADVYAKQTLADLPAGTYTLTAMGRRNNTSVVMSVYAVVDGVEYKIDFPDNETWNELKVENIKVENGSMEIGFKGTTNDSWVNVDNFKLYYAGAVVEDNPANPDTAIDAVEADTETVIYDLQGRRVAKMEKGIYIVNGKKVVIK